MNKEANSSPDKDLEIEQETTSAPRVLIIEDDFAIRNSVEYALRREGYTVKSLDTGSDAVGIVADFAPDLVLVDVMLPGKTGHQITEELRQSDTDIAIIMISALGEIDDRITGLRLGADDYVSKPFSLDELLERVRANLRRSIRDRKPDKQGANSEKNATADSVLSATDASLSKDCSVLNFNNGLLIVDPIKREARLNGSTMGLRAKEFALLYALASRPDEVLTRDFLSTEVWGHDHIHSSRTIDVHMRRLRALLAKHNAPQYLRTVHGVGYRFDSAAKDLADSSTLRTEETLTDNSSDTDANNAASRSDRNKKR